MKDLILSAAEDAVREMAEERGYTVRRYADGWVISGHRFCLPVKHLAYVTAQQLDPPWLRDEDEDFYLDGETPLDVALELGIVHS